MSTLETYSCTESSSHPIFAMCIIQTRLYRLINDKLGLHVLATKLSVARPLSIACNN